MSWAWYEGVCVCRRGELKFAHIAIHPYCKLPTFQIRPYFKFAPIPNSPIANCPHCKLPSFQIAPIANRPWDKKLEKSFLL